MSFFARASVLGATLDGNASVSDKCVSQDYSEPKNDRHTGFDLREWSLISLIRSSYQQLQHTWGWSVPTHMPVDRLRKQLPGHLVADSLYLDRTNMREFSVDTL